MTRPTIASQLSAAASTRAAFQAVIQRALTDLNQIDFTGMPSPVKGWDVESIEATLNEWMTHAPDPERLSWWAQDRVAEDRVFEGAARAEALRETV